MASMVDLIAGTSTGGIIACGLAKPDPMSGRGDRGDLRDRRAEDLRSLGAEGHHVGERLPGRALRLGRPGRVTAPSPRRRTADRRHHAHPAHRLRPRGAPGAAPALRRRQHGRRRARHLGGADLLRAGTDRRPHARRRRRVRDQPRRVRVHRERSAAGAAALAGHGLAHAPAALRRGQGLGPAGVGRADHRRRLRRLRGRRRHATPGARRRPLRTAADPSERGQRRPRRRERGQPRRAPARSRAADRRARRRHRPRLRQYWRVRPRLRRSSPEPTARPACCGARAGAPRATTGPP